MNIQEFFRDPSTRPRAIAVSFLLGGVLAYGAYQFWVNREAVSGEVKHSAHRIGDAASKVGTKVGETAHTVGGKIGDAAHVVGSKVSEAAHKLGEKTDDALHKARDVFHRTEASAESHLQKISHKLPPAKTRVDEFKKIHLERFFEAKQAALKESDKKVLDYSTLTRIQQLAIEISEKDFRKVVKVNREQRRKLLEHEKPKYEEVVIHGEKDFEQIFTENLNEILSECGVSQEKYNDSMAEHVKTDENTYLVGASLYDVMLGRLTSVNEPVPPTKEYVTEIHNYMIDQYQKIFYKPIHKEYFTDVKEKMLLDKVHEKYGLEEEDIRKLRKNFDTIEIKELREKLNTHIANDEKHFGEFGTDK